MSTCNVFVNKKNINIFGLEIVPYLQQHDCIIKQQFFWFLSRYLTLKTEADDILNFFSEEMRLDILCESSAYQTIHKIYKALLSQKKYLVWRLLLQ